MMARGPAAGRRGGLLGGGAGDGRGRSGRGVLLQRVGGAAGQRHRQHGRRGGSDHTTVVANAAPTIPASERKVPTHQARLAVQFGQEFLGLIGDAAAQHDEIRPQQGVHFIQYQIQLLGPRIPAQVLVHLGASGGAQFRLAPGDLEVAEFGVRHELAVDEQGAADAGAQSQQEHGARHVARGAIAQFGEARRIGIVDGDHGPPQVLAGQRRQRLADPRLVEIRRRAHDAVAYHAGKCQAHGMIARNVRHHGLQARPAGFRSSLAPASAC